MKRKIWVEAFRLNEKLSGNVRLEQVLKAIDGVPLHNREVDISGEPVRQEALAAYGPECWEAEFFRVRRVRLPHIIGKGEPATPLTLPEHQGLGEPTAIFYHPGTRVLLTHTAKEGVPLASVLRYVQSFHPQQLPLHVEPILREDALERLMKLKNVKEMKVQFAGVSPGLFNKPGTSMRAYREMAETLRAPVMSVRLSMGRQKGSLDVRRCIDWAKELLEAEPSDVAEIEELSVRGESAGDSKTLPIDLLQERMRQQSDLEEGPDRSVSFAALCQCLREVWHLNEKKLRAMFPPKEDDHGG